MVNTAVAAIIGAVFAALGGFIGTITTGWWVQHNEWLKRRREERDAVRRYYDPLLRASQHLQSRIWVLCQRRIAMVNIAQKGVNDPGSYDYAYTLFLFGQFFAWNWANRNDVRGIYHTPSREDQKLLNVLYKIERALHDPNGGGDSTFQIFNGIQTAIGEIMTKKDANSPGNGTMCIGYAEFILAWLHNDWTRQVSFQQWFGQITAGISTLYDVEAEFPFLDKAPPSVPPDFPLRKLDRLIRLQHLLVELIEVLDSYERRSHEHGRQLIPRLDPAFECTCERCPQAKTLFDGRVIDCPVSRISRWPLTTVPGVGATSYAANLKLVYDYDTLRGRKDNPFSKTQGNTQELMPPWNFMPVFPNNNSKYGVNHNPNHVSNYWTNSLAAEQEGPGWREAERRSKRQKNVGIVDPAAGPGYY